MTDNTRLSLVDIMIKALKSDDFEKIKDAQYLLSTKCNQSNISWALFLINEVAPVMSSPVTLEYKSIHKIQCPYCEQSYSSEVGLKSHLGKRHQDNKYDWSNKN